VPVDAVTPRVELKNVVLINKTGVLLVHPPEARMRPAETIAAVFGPTADRRWHWDLGFGRWRWRRWCRLSAFPIPEARGTRFPGTGHLIWDFVGCVV
jgi:hypothetical protein